MHHRPERAGETQSNPPESAGVAGPGSSKTHNAQTERGCFNAQARAEKLEDVSKKAQVYQPAA
jgi:hypothetical protein